MKKRGEYGDPLTDREVEVLEGMADGKSNAKIGADLYIAEDTVKSHVRYMFAKLGAQNRTHAVALGYRMGLLKDARTVSSPLHTARIRAASAYLAEWQKDRAIAPRDSRFAALYDGLAERIGFSPPS